MPDGTVTQRDMKSFTPCPEPQRDFRDALGCFATGVTIVTCRDADGPLAMTANSFAAVSLDPPLVLWSPGKFSSRYQSFVDAKHFAIHVLTSEQADLGTRFAKDGRAFDGTPWTEDANGVPLLPGCLTQFTCSQHATHPGGDHTIIIGRVENAVHGPGTTLIFAQGSYGRFTDGV